MHACREGAKFTSAALLLKQAAERARLSEAAAANLMHVVRIDNRAVWVWHGGMAHERGTPPLLSRRTCSHRCRLQS
jgi:hypothetical protein